MVTASSFCGAYEDSCPLLSTSPVVTHPKESKDGRISCVPWVTTDHLPEPASSQKSPVRPFASAAYREAVSWYPTARSVSPRSTISGLLMTGVAVLSATWDGTPSEITEREKDPNG